MMFILDAITSSLASLLRLGRGSRRQRGAVSAQPSQLLELYSFENCPWCRRVRERLTELDLDYIHRSCPVGDSEKRKALLARGGKMQVPYLIDPNTSTELYESSDILDYLQRTYGSQA